MQNPFNGIERKRFTEQLRITGSKRIHSMELKDASSTLFVSDASLLLNPFNGIESHHPPLKLAVSKNVGIHSMELKGMLVLKLPSAVREDGIHSMELKGYSLTYE